MRKYSENVLSKKPSTTDISATYKVVSDTLVAPCPNLDIVGRRIPM